MYTKCPSCRSEISFEPPANMSSLPDGYKHRIKCPYCGVTIGVKIPKVTSEATVFAPQNPYETNPEPVMPMENVSPVSESASTKEKKKAAKAAKAAKGDKKAGTGRNIFMMLLSLVLVAVSALAYLNSTGKLSVDLLNGLAAFDGITIWKSIIVDKFNPFAGEILDGIYAILPLIVFTLAGINFIVALISCFGKKYGRAWNFIASLIIAAAAIVSLFVPVIKGANLVEYFLTIISDGKYLIFVAPGVAFIEFLFALIFLKSLKKKA